MIILVRLFGFSGSVNIPNDGYVRLEDGATLGSLLDRVEEMIAGADGDSELKPRDYSALAGSIVMVGDERTDDQARTLMPEDAVKIIKLRVGG